MKSVYIVILNWNGWENTLECLESIYNSDYSNFEAVVVDNGSTDGSPKKIKNWARENNIATLSLLETGKNLGFSKGVNKGIKYALINEADYIFLLNNDIIVKKDTLSKLLNSIQADKRIGAVYPKILSPNGKLQVPVERRPAVNFWELLIFSNSLSVLGNSFTRESYLEKRSAYKDYQYDKLIAVPNIVVAGALYRREFFEKVGLFDENIFMYFEENILMEKIKKTNFIFCLEPSTELIHKIGGDNQKLPRPFLYTESLRSEIYCAENYMGLKKWQLISLRTLRFLYYVYCMVKLPEYRKHFPTFVKKYLLWRPPLVVNKS